MTAVREEDVHRLQALHAVGVVATNRPDGWPHLVPVWYVWADAAVNVWTNDKRLWVRNARRDPRVAFSVQENGPPFGAVLIRGEAEVLGATWPGFARTVRAITARYVPADEVERYIAEWTELQTLVRIHPLDTRGWSRGY
jgi:PPOX class probable F420-dependent enzyme